MHGDLQWSQTAPAARLQEVKLTPVSYAVQKNPKASLEQGIPGADSTTAPVKHIPVIVQNAAR